MKDMRTLLAELELCIESEIRAQQRVLGQIEVQEKAIQTGSPDEIATATAVLELELRGGAERGSQRIKILTGLAAHWHVAARSLTLSSIIERAGALSGRLGQLRGELRTTMAEVVRRCRRMGALARTNGQILNEAIESVLRQKADERVSDGGTLVNAEA